MTIWDNIPCLYEPMHALEDALQRQFQSASSRAYLDALALALVRGGGKRLRPALVFSAAMMGQYNFEATLCVAQAMELLHMATLVHDDIIDQAEYRRGHKTISADKGNFTAVFAGDFLFVESVMLLAKAGLPTEKLQETAKATQEICIGEVNQHLNRGKIPTFRSYLGIVSRKTASLFACCCALGGYCAGLDEKMLRHLTKFGGYMGIAFQIQDDLLDVTATQSRIGKDSLNDLRQGIVTLPLILGAAKDEAIKSQIDDLLRHKNLTKKHVAQLVKNASMGLAIEEAKQIRQRYLAKAERELSFLPAGDGRDSLHRLLVPTSS